MKVKQTGEMIVNEYKHVSLFLLSVESHRHRARTMKKKTKPNKQKKRKSIDYVHSWLKKSIISNVVYYLV